MKYKNIIFISAIVIVLLIPAAHGAATAHKTQFPCQKYSCYDTSDPNFQCPDGLVPIRGWCTGPNNIQMCGPPDTPTGPYLNTDMRNRIYSGEFAFCGQENKDVQEVRTADFKVTINGHLGGCEYWVENNDKKTRDETKTDCGSEVTITVGSGGDCPETGECIVWSNGGWGFKHRAGTFQVSTTHCRQPYQQFTCMNNLACKERGGTPKRGFCPGPYSIQCCTFGTATEEITDSIYDNAEILTNDKTLESRLTRLFRNKNVKVVIETRGAIGEDPATLISQKFRDEYDMRGIGIPALNLLVIYGQKENKFIIGHARDCGFTAIELEEIVSNSRVKAAIQQSDYNRAFDIFTTLIVSRANSKSAENIRCFEEKPEDSCTTACGKGFFSRCTPNKCKEIGCSYSEKYEICVDADIYESTLTIKERLNAVKRGFKGFVYKDPICHGANCAAYVTRVHEYIFGIGKHFITGVGGNAWQMPRFIEEHDGTIQWFDWRNGEIFTDYDSLIPGDIIGFHYSLSDYLPEKKGQELGNTPDIDFTHVALYLGKRGNKHYITHQYNDAIRTGSIEDLLRRNGNIFKIRVVMRPNQELLYRIPPADYKPSFETKKIEEGDNVASIVPGVLAASILPNQKSKKEELMWLTADINNLVENVAPLERYKGRTIRIPNSLPNDYDHEYLSETLSSAEQRLATDLENTILNKYPNKKSARKWAQAIVRHAKYKTPEYVTLLASFIDQESAFPDEGDIGRAVSDTFARTVYGVADFIGIADRNPSLGCFNLKLCNAVDIARRYGRDINNVEEELRTQEGCLFYGNKYVENIVEAYAPGGKFTEQSLLFIAADFHAGAFSSRNAAIQKQLNDLMDTNLVLDGDLLGYEKTCPPQPREEPSNTERVIQDFAQSQNLNIPNSRTRAMLTLEKRKEFEQTEIYKAVKSAWKRQFGQNAAYAIVADAQTYAGGRTGTGSSLNFAIRTKDYYNSYCDSMTCTDPASISIAVA